MAYQAGRRDGSILTALMRLLSCCLRHPVIKAGTSLSEVKLNSINDVLTAFTAMDGPDDSLKRPNSLIDDDSDDKPEVSSSKNNNYDNNNN
ncbi:hypothetical protein BGX30_002624 [Mortierella sp. GBA39]|nr:hypothetical protein BGX30_002624 [Mortierella sp. GBA39]